MSGRSHVSAQGKPENVKAMDVEAHRDLRLLEAVHRDSRVTQRGLAGKLGIALGLANIYLKRMIHKGYIKCVNVQPNRLRYLLTPKGIVEKTRLTYEFMEYSLSLYARVRLHLRGVLEPCTQHPRRPRIAVYGTGEAAELAYLSITELGLEMVAVFDGAKKGHFLGQPIRPIADHGAVPFDLLLVATLDRTDALVEELMRLGVARDRMVTLRQ